MREGVQPVPAAQARPGAEHERTAQRQQPPGPAGAERPRQREGEDEGGEASVRGERLEQSPARLARRVVLAERAARGGPQEPARAERDESRREPEQQGGYPADLPPAAPLPGPAPFAAPARPGRRDGRGRDVPAARPRPPRRRHPAPRLLDGHGPPGRGRPRVPLLPPCSHPVSLIARRTNK
ncbi:hypothetical protein SSBG_06183 [Streptomyces sp. SPB074]|nr:hypothetical protein SSBG_06183 [Streptomyces sp. SPB074]